jgi:dienelactone hydrolase
MVILGAQAPSEPLLLDADLRVLKEGSAGSEELAATMLERFLIEQAAGRLEARRRAIAAIKTPEEIRRRQVELRSFFWRSLGDLPERTPLNARVVGVHLADGYRVERILFESRPGHHVTALLYLPEGAESVPGVLVPCGHSNNGKAAESYQRVCILLARSGMAALCYDPIGQGERIQWLDEQGGPAVAGGSTTEHTLAGVGALLVGWQTATYRVWDGLRALDYLESRPEVDPKRLGCTGNSGGGTLTAYLMALDDRIAAAVPSCYITSLERLFRTIGPQDAEQNITGQVAAGMDHADYVIMRAPRPTLLCVGTQDFFDIQGSWETFREVKLIYGRLGYGERVDLFESDEPHGLTQPRRVATARWLRRWLLRIDDAVDEPDFPIAADRELQCTRSGQVLRDLGGVSVFDLNHRRERELASARAEFARTADAPAFRARVRQRLGLGTGSVPAQTLVLAGELHHEGRRILKLVFETEPGILIPVIAVEPKWPDPVAPIVIRVGGNRTVDLAPGGPVDQQLGRGRWVLLADLRGMGETAPPPGKGWGGPLLGPEVSVALLSLHLARPLLGQRVLDLQTFMASLREREEFATNAAHGFELEAEGAAGLAALHAAILDDQGAIRRLTLLHPLISWSNVVEHKGGRLQIGGVVPGALEDYDLPDLIARLEPLPVSIREPVDALGRPVSKETLEAVYAAAIQAHAAEQTLELLPAP